MGKLLSGRDREEPWSFTSFAGRGSQRDTGFPAIGDFEREPIGRAPTGYIEIVR